MPVRYIGREPYHKGKSLYEICRQLRDLGVGRVVYQKSVALKYPKQKSYFKLSKVVPDMSNNELCAGTAWGHEVFRGKEKGLREITVGHQFDWILVPKEEEAEFCSSTEVHDVDVSSLPSHIDCPPLLEIVLKQELRAKGQQVPEKVQLPFISDDFIKDLETR